jgi:glycosyltransferase involved in cell wall biosynthesis
MACGTPVIATSVGGITEQIRGLSAAGVPGGNLNTYSHDQATGVLTPLGDVDAITTAALALLRDPELSEAVSRNAADLVRMRFDIKQQKTDYLSFFLDALQDHRRFVTRDRKGRTTFLSAAAPPAEQAISKEPSRWQIVTENKADPGYPDDMNYLISVIIPCYNYPDLLAETLESVTEQSYSPIEIVIVDDGSQESLLEPITRTLSGFNGSWKLLRLERNSGPGIARRAGLQAASGHFIQYLDADDIMHPEKLVRQVTHLNDCPELTMTYALSGYHTPERSIDAEPVLGRTDVSFSRILPHILERIVWTTSSCLWRRSLVGEDDFWKPLYAAEDLVFDFLVGLSDLPIGKTPSDIPLLFKRIHPGSLSYNVANDAAYQQEILKAYDYMWQAAQEAEQSEQYRHVFARLYAGKIMRFLILRRYWEADYCIRRIAVISPDRLPLDARLAVSLNRLFDSFLGFVILRKWRWVVKILSRTFRRQKQ